MDLLTLLGVEVGYHRRPILPPVDLTIRRGTFLGIVGPNGSGKTTLVRTMLGLLSPIRGRVEHPLTRAPRFGYVPQRPELERTFPISAIDMVLMGRFAHVGLGRRVGGAERDKAMKALADVGLRGLELRPLHGLSGGQRQRALIARALVTEPEILILDEPTTGMDLVAEQSLVDLIERFRLQYNLGVVMISHHLGLVANAARDVMLVDKDRSAVIHGPVEEIVTPEKLSALYRKKVSVTEVAGHRMIFLQAGEMEDHQP